MPPKYNLWFELKKSCKCALQHWGQTKSPGGMLCTYKNLQIRNFFYSKYFPLLCVPGSAQAHRNYLGLSVVPIQHYNLLQSVEYFGTIMDCWWFFMVKRPIKNADLSMPIILQPTNEVVLGIYTSQHSDDRLGLKSSSQDASCRSISAKKPNYGMLVVL